MADPLRGIFRPGLKTIGLQATESGGSGDGYSITAAGRAWLEAADESNFVSTEPSRFAKIAARFRDQLGDGYFQRAQEAARSHFATAYLASCAMSGAAAESILLRVAIAKEADEKQVPQTYRSANGRKRVENLIVGQLSRHFPFGLPPMRLRPPKVNFQAICVSGPRGMLRASGIMRPSRLIRPFAVSLGAFSDTAFPLPAPDLADLDGVLVMRPLPLLVARVGR